MKHIMKRKLKEDAVNNPSHYNTSGIECFEAIAPPLGDGYQAITYRVILLNICGGIATRASPVEDLQKAQFYLDRLILELENEQDES